MPNNGLKKQVKIAFLENKINQLPVDGNMEIRKMLIKLFTLTGLKKENFPDEFQTDVLIEFLRNDLGNFSLAEMELAFRLAMKNELEVDANHYQSFSGVYIAQIMSGYIPVRKRMLDAVKAAENAVKKEIEKGYKPEEMKTIKNDYVLECLIKPWRYYLKTGQLTFGITPFSIIYKTLTDDFQMLELTGEEKKSIHDQAVNQVKNKINSPSNNYDNHKKNQKIKDIIKKEGFLNAMDDEIKSICYEISVREFYKKAKENNVDLELLLTQKLEKNGK